MAVTTRPIAGLKMNERQQMDALDMLKQIPTSRAKLAFFDPQYRAVLDKMKYGNEGERQIERSKLPQMSHDDITRITIECHRVLAPSGHLILWLDKFAIGSGHHVGFARRSGLQVVDLIAWNKLKDGMGKRCRCRTEYAVIMQHPPQRAEGIWEDHRLPDCWPEHPDRSEHAHAKPHQLTERLIRAVTKKGDLVVDPCAGGYGVLDACILTGRNFVGCDLV